MKWYSLVYMVGLVICLLLSFLIWASEADDRDKGESVFRVFIKKQIYISFLLSLLSWITIIFIVCFIIYEERKERRRIRRQWNCNFTHLQYENNNIGNDPLDNE